MRWLEWGSQARAGPLRWRAMADDRKAAERYLNTFALIAPLGLFVALVFEPTGGGGLVIVALASGLYGLHRLGRLGPLDRIPD